MNQDLSEDEKQILKEEIKKVKAAKRKEKARLKKEAKEEMKESTTISKEDITLTREEVDDIVEAVEPDGFMVFNAEEVHTGQEAEISVSKRNVVSVSSFRALGGYFVIKLKDPLAKYIVKSNNKQFKQLCEMLK